MSQTLDTQSQALKKREEHLSKDGQWRSFPKVPHLLQYVSNGNYYGRIKIGGKIIRESLKTDVWTTAKLRLTDFLKEHQEARCHLPPPMFTEAVDLFKRDLESDAAIKPQSKGYRLGCLRKIELSWPGLWKLRLDQITAQACKDWAAKLSNEIACHYYNNTIATLRQVLQAAFKSHKEKGGGVLENPAAELKRVRVKQKYLQLPESSHFKSLVENLRMRSGGWGPRVADLIEFLAYSGLRIRSEALWVTWNDIDWKRKEIIVRGKHLKRLQSEGVLNPAGQTSKGAYKFTLNQEEYERQYVNLQEQPCASNVHLDHGPHNTQSGWLIGNRIPERRR
jgi:hypothetical protein